MYKWAFDREKEESSAWFFFFYSHEYNSSSLVCLAAPCDILGVGRMVAFIVYFELAGTSMLSGARPGFDGGVFPAAILFRLWTSACQEGIFFVVMWRRACLVRWSLRMNLLSHTGHTNFFSPVCVRRWRESSSDRANLLSQPSQLQLKGFSPKRRKQESEESANESHCSHKSFKLCLRHNNALTLFPSRLPRPRNVSQTRCNTHLWSHFVPHPHEYPTKHFYMQ